MMGRLVLCHATIQFVSLPSWHPASSAQYLLNIGFELMRRIQLHCNIHCCSYQQIYLLQTQTQQSSCKQTELLVRSILLFMLRSYQNIPSSLGSPSPITILFSSLCQSAISVLLYFVNTGRGFVSSVNYFVRPSHLSQRQKCFRHL